MASNSQQTIHIDATSMSTQETENELRACNDKFLSVFRKFLRDKYIGPVVELLDGTMHVYNKDDIYAKVRVCKVTPEKVQYMVITNKSDEVIFSYETSYSGDTTRMSSVYDEYEREYSDDDMAWHESHYEYYDYD